MAVGLLFVKGMSIAIIPLAVQIELYFAYEFKYILLKRSLESVARISLYYRLQTLADSEGVDRSRYNFQRMFPA